MSNKERKIVLNESQLIDVISYAYNKYSQKPNDKNIFENLFDEYKFLNEAEDEEAADEPAEDKVDKVTDEQLRVDSLKIAVKLARLMNKVTPEDMLEISTKVSAYLKNHKVGEEFVPEESEEVPLENEEEAPDDEEVADVENDETSEADDVDSGVEEFIIDDDDEDNSEEDEDEAESANEGGSDIPEEFIL